MYIPCTVAVFFEVYLLFYSDAWVSYFTHVLSLRLVRGVEARNYVRSKFSQWALSMIGTICI